MKKFQEVLLKVKTHTEEDWISLNDIVIEFTDIKNNEPDRNEFIEALKFIEIILEGNGFICLIGPDMKQAEGTGKDIADWLLKLYDRNGFDHIHYGIWFDRT